MKKTNIEQQKKELLGMAKLLNKKTEEQLVNIFFWGDRIEVFYIEHDYDDHYDRELRLDLAEENNKIEIENEKLKKERKDLESKIEELTKMRNKIIKELSVNLSTNSKDEH